MDRTEHPGSRRLIKHIVMVEELDELGTATSATSSVCQPDNGGGRCRYDCISSWSPAAEGLRGSSRCERPAYRGVDDFAGTTWDIIENARLCQAPPRSSFGREALIPDIVHPGGSRGQRRFEQAQTPSRLLEAHRGWTRAAQDDRCDFGAGGHRTLAVTTGQKWRPGGHHQPPRLAPSVRPAVGRHPGTR